MSTLNWPLLNWASFESLVHTIIFYQDPKASLFNRAGKDSAQDAKSGDGKTVYQAKFHVTKLNDPSTAFQDAKDEFDKIKKYQKENDPRWTGVTQWILATPIPFGSQDDQKWQNEIVPLFKTINLDAQIWHAAQLEAKVLERPELKELCFEGTNRCFLSIPEKRMLLEEDRLSNIGLQVAYIGQSEILKQAKDFLSTPKKKLLPVIGQGGVGKTRFLYEIGLLSIEQQLINQVLWAQTSTLGSSEHWFKAIASARHTPTLVLLDGLDTLEYQEAQKILRTFREQILTPQSTWKAIIVVPSPEWFDGIINSTRFSSDADPITINQLTNPEATKVAQEILKAQRPDIRGLTQEKTCEDIAKHSNSMPLWIVAETCILSESGSLIKSIKDPFGIAKHYLKKNLQGFGEHEIEDILFWISIYQPVQKTDANFLKFISDQSKITIKKIEQMIAEAEKQKLIYSYGISDRYIKFVPQGLADHVVYRKLITTSGKPSETASAIFNDLIKNYDTIFEPEHLLHALGKLSFHNDAFKNVLKTFSQTLIKEIKKSKDVSSLKKYFDLAKPLSIYVPDQFLNIIAQFRNKTNVPDKTIKVQYLPAYTSTYKKEVLSNLARTVYDGASFAHDDQTKENLLKEMIALCEMEFQWFTSQEIEKRNNEDKGGLRKLSDILYMGSPYLSDYQTMAREFALQNIEKLENKKPNPAELKICEAIIKPQLKVERQITHWFDDKIGFESRPIHGFIEETRRLTVTKLQDILKQEGKLSSYQFLLILLAEAHHEANGASLGRWLNPPKDEQKKVYLEEVKANLEIIYSIFEKLSLEEKEIAQKIWDWHLRFDERNSVKKLASKCEELRQKNLNNLDLSIFSFNRFEQGPPSDIDESINKIAKSLVKETAEEIHHYLDEALILEAANHTGEYITQLAEILGQKYFDAPSIQKYVVQSIASKNLDGRLYGHFQIAIVVVATQCAMIRNKKQEKTRNLKKLINSYLKRITVADNKIKFLYTLYEDRRGSKLSKSDQELILESQPVFVKKKAYPSYFYLLGRIFLLNPALISKTVESLWPKIAPDARQSSYEALLNGFGRHPQNIDAHKKWLFEQSVWINDPDHLDRVFRFTDIFRDWIYPLSDFYRLVLKRLELKKGKGNSDYKIIPDDEFLKWIERIDAGSDQKAMKTIITKLLALDEKKNWEIKYYLPKALAHIDPHGIILPSVVAKKIKSLESLSKIIEWVHYAGYYSERTEPWKKIVIPALEAAKDADEKTKNSIYSKVCEDVIEPSSWCGSVSEAWGDRVSHAETDLKNETGQRLHDYLQWKVDYLKAQCQHFTEWETED